MRSDILDIPRKTSIIALTAASLRRGIDNGQWTGFLPSERQLSDMLQVSRPTVALALASLKREGLIQSERGKGHRVLRASAGGESDRQRKVNLLFIENSKNERNQAVSAYSDELRRRLYSVGYHLEVIGLTGLNEKRPENALRKFAARKPADLWILYSTPPTVQQWFSAQSLPALIFGSNEASVKLPSIDMDYYATGRHAAGTFIHLGHRNIACFLPLRTRAGDLATKAGFEAGIRSHRGDPAAGTIVWHGPTAHDICIQLDRLLTRNPSCTGILVVQSLHAITVLSYLLRSGHNIPRDISVIVCDGESFLRHFTPTPSYYEYNVQLFATKLARLAVQFCTLAVLPHLHSRIVPKFLPGETLAPPPRNVTSVSR